MISHNNSLPLYNAHTNTELQWIYTYMNCSVIIKRGERRCTYVYVMVDDITVVACNNTQA